MLGVGICVSRETFLLLPILPSGRRDGEPGEGHGPGFGGAAREAPQPAGSPAESTPSRESLIPEDSREPIDGAWPGYKAADVPL